jgi:hypothetical protein
MTNAQQQEFNRGFLKVYCRGPRRLHEDRMRAINAKRHRLIDEQDWHGLKQLTIALNEILGASELPTEDTLGAWNTSLVKLMDLRTHCGQDISELIGAPPYDGERHTVLCPACSTEHLYRSALSDEEAAKKQTVFQTSLDQLTE